MVCLCGWLAWKGTSGSPGPRWLMFLMRVLAISLVILLLSNPGRWVTEGEEEPPGWALLVDRSGSMKTADVEGKPRREAAQNFARKLLEVSRHPEEITARLFSKDLGGPWSKDESPAADSEGTRLVHSGMAMLDQAAESGARWTGLLILSDGRETEVSSPREALIARARGLGVPIHGVVYGDRVLRKDLALRLPSRQIVTLPNQTASVPVQLENQGFGPVQPEIRLLPPGDGANAIATLKLAVQPGETVSGAFELPVGSVEGNYRVEMQPMPGDERPANDSGKFHLRVLENRTRVFLAEGAPYWDTKFLAQLLREQGMMDVEAVYRLQPERFYRVVTGSGTKLEETQRIFPENSAELNRHDLVVLGKGADAFLTPERLDMLKSFVRDQGGALLLSRGKPYAGTFEAMEALEPGRWGEETGTEYKLIPTPDGEESGLFGERLPSAKADVWRALPALTDVRAMAELRPFTRVLAVGERVGGGSKVPLLVARRYGRGFVAAVNGDGLWRWGFNPTKKADEDWHRDFWLQLLQWAATYSEFLPGEDYSLHLSGSSAAEGETVRARMGYRGNANPIPQPILELVQPDGTIERIPGAPAGTGEDGHPRWGAIFTPKVSGTCTVRLTAGGKPGPAVPLQIVPPPREDDERSADPKLLTEITEASGGRMWTPEQWKELLATLEPAVQRVQLQEARWVPLWNQIWTLAAIAVLLAGEWIIRRRNGLL
jgi:hypothetical protein